MAQLWLIIGLAVGALGVWFALRGRLAELASAVSGRAEAERELAGIQATLQSERDAAARQLALVEEAQAKLSDSFKALAGEALQSNNKAFVDLAKSELAQQQIKATEDLEKRKQAMEVLVKPISESLTKVDTKIEQLEQARREAQGALFNQLKTVTTGQDQLRKETANLVTALRAPHTRGRWGEVQLRRVCEMAGMQSHCDFMEQKTISSDDGLLRPDVIVQLPGDKQVIVDAKVPLAAYLDAIDAEDESTRKTFLQAHVRQMRDHVKKLAAKSYWSEFAQSAEFVVMFVDEGVYRVALDEDPQLMEDAFSQHVLIATPTSLLGLLHAVNYGWRQEKMAQSAEEVQKLGHELHSRLSKFAETLAKIGRSLGTSVNAYNDAVGSFDSRVLVSARKLSEHGAGSESKELATPAQVEVHPRAVQSRQLEEVNPDEIVIRRLDAA